MSLDYFDLPEFQQEVREAKSAQSLFLLWDRVCQLYDTDGCCGGSHGAGKTAPCSDAVVRRSARAHDRIAQFAHPLLVRPLALLQNGGCVGISHRIVTNLFYDELRKRPRDIQLVSADEPVAYANDETGVRDLVDESLRPDDLLLSNELSEVIEQAILKIPSQFRTVVLLRDVSGFSYDQIAEVTQTDLGTVKSRISRGRAKIQRYLNRYLGECA